MVQRTGHHRVHLLDLPEPQPTYVQVNRTELPTMSTPNTARAQDEDHELTQALADSCVHSVLHKFQELRLYLCLNAH